MIQSMHACQHISHYQMIYILCMTPKYFDFTKEFSSILIAQQRLNIFPSTKVLLKSEKKESSREISDFHASYSSWLLILVTRLARLFFAQMNFQAHSNTNITQELGLSRFKQRPPLPCQQLRGREKMPKPQFCWQRQGNLEYHFKIYACASPLLLAQVGEVPDAKPNKSQISAVNLFKKYAQTFAIFLAEVVQAEHIVADSFIINLKRLSL